MKRLVYVVVILLGLGFGEVRPVQASVNSSGAPQNFSPDALDLTLTSAGLAVWIATAVFKGQLAPAQCRWCDRNSDGSDALNFFDRWGRDALRWGNPGSAYALSDVVAFAVLPLGALATPWLVSDGGPAGAGEAWNDVYSILQAAVAAGLVNQAAKFIAGRQRPNAHFGNPTGTSEDNVSFFSGHSALAFALAASAGTVAARRHSPYQNWVWGVGLTLAGATAYLRVAADVHYLTDVLVGAGVGTLAGILIPRINHSNVSISAGPHSLALKLSF